MATPTKTKDIEINNRAQHDVACEKVFDKINHKEYITAINNTALTTLAVCYIDDFDAIKHIELNSDYIINGYYVDDNTLVYYGKATQKIIDRKILEYKNAQ